MNVKNLKILRKSFEELGGLRNNRPGDPGLGPGKNGEIRRHGDQFFVATVENGVCVWHFIEMDQKKISEERSERGEINKKISYLLGLIPVREYLREPDDGWVRFPEEGYSVLSTISNGLSRSSVSSADKIIGFLNSIVDDALYLVSWFFRSCVAMGEFSDAANLLTALSEKGATPCSYQTDFAHAKDLHGDFYMGHAILACFYQRDADETLLWASRAKKSCMGLPGVVDQAQRLELFVHGAREAMKRGVPSSEAFKLTGDKPLYLGVK